MRLVSPNNGRDLVPDGAQALTDGAGERWPVVDGIPFLRAGREALASAALERLDAGDRAGALALLLADADPWWDEAPPPETELRAVVEQADTLSLREVMARLGWGRVGDYFAHRWTDPTYLAGLALLEAHWTNPATAFELACGIGHYLRELTERSVACVGADIVFAKCWLAKHWVAPRADYVVFDAAHPWPILGANFDLVMCHDAFYFLPDQAAVAERLRALTEAGGVLAISHLHNSEFWDGAKGPARPPEAWAELFPEAVLYDEGDLQWALMRADAPTPIRWDDEYRRLETEAFSLVETKCREAMPIEGRVAMPKPDAKLRRNPLLGEALGHEHVRWPSERYRLEYGPGCFWANSDDDFGSDVIVDPVRLRRLVDLPERW